MIPVAQLDPASLTVWFDPEVVSVPADRDGLMECLFAAFRSDIPAARAAYRALPPESRPRAADLVSSIWHEHRHFLDLILTNYGAFRVRQFFEVYINLAPVLGEFLRTGTEIVFPLDVCANPLRRRSLKIPEPGPNAAALARAVQHRRQTLEADREPWPTQWGLMRCGGEAQLESLAFLCQQSAVMAHFGQDGGRRMWEAIPERQWTNVQYRWAELIGDQFGLLPHRKGDGGQHVDPLFVFALLFASLMQRAWGQTQSENDTGGSGLPLKRFIGFCHALRGQKVEFGELKTPEIWALLNDTAFRLWGRTVEDELREDYKCEAQWCDQIANSPDDVFPAVAEAVQDFHRLRGRLIATFLADPIPVLDPVIFSHGLLSELRPYTIVAQKSGHIGRVEEGWRRVFGYKDETTTGPESEWGWAYALPAEDGDTNPRVEPFGFHQYAAWTGHIASFAAPVTKLLMNGRVHRTILGPELVHGQKRLELLNLRFRFDPQFEFPKETNEIASFYHLTAQDSVVCDWCRERVYRPDGHLVSPWLFRYHPHNAEMCIRAFGGGETGRLRFLRDWSPWVFCSNCHEKFIRPGQPKEG